MRSMFRALIVALPVLSGVGVNPLPLAAQSAQAVEWTVPATPPPAPISREEYGQRRAALAAEMGQGVFVAFGSPESDADYLPFAQNSPFRYLTGITEPGAALVIVKNKGGVQEQLFVLPRNPAREVWEGARLGAEGAEQLTGIPTRAVSALMPRLDSLLARHATLYSVVPAAEGANLYAPLSREQQIINALVERNPKIQLISADEALQRIRGTKSATELDLIRRAILITNLAQRAAMRTIEPGMNEFEIQALIEYTFRRHGAERPAFSTIVGSGPNSTTLHYNADDRFMEPADLVVMDIGASYRGYAADVTRTVPVDGTFSPEQRAIYEIVLEAQKAAEAEARPGATWNELNAAANRVLANGLTELGLVESPSATYDCQSARFGDECPQWRLFYMHGLGHGIGLDVHDPDVSYFEPFAVGSAFTIEPGVYVRADALDYLPDTPRNRAMAERIRSVVEQYQNIGVRIEDDYFITPTGTERLSEGAPREIEEIEALMREEPIGAEERRAEIVEWYRGTKPR